MIWNKPKHNSAFNLLFSFLQARNGTIDGTINAGLKLNIPVCILTHLFPMYPFSTPWKH